MKEVLIPIPFERLEEGGYLAMSPVRDDLLAQGRAIGQALEVVRDVARRLIESDLERGDPLPEVHTMAYAAALRLAGKARVTIRSTRSLSPSGRNSFRGGHFACPGQPYRRQTSTRASSGRVSSTHTPPAPRYTSLALPSRVMQGSTRTLGQTLPWVHGQAG